MRSQRISHPQCFSSLSHMQILRFRQSGNNEPTMSQSPEITGVTIHCPHFCSPGNNSLVSPISRISDRDYLLGTLPSSKEET
ncbi:hypothetical protein BJX68DRAFT_227192 [Aspergillus pseudodeflectus]|uniref:Uncharacterized protein n=1 Tax=Aspergillus pseudodeflectus TaxID=176178 RepID=A0ABR4L340_9EURO